MPQIQVPDDSSPAPGGLSKRTLLIGAAILGGGVGLVLLISRLSSRNDVNASTNQATTTAPDTSALGIGYQNLATQLLGFRGDMSVASAETNANLLTLNDSITAATAADQAGNTDLLSAIGAESTGRALSDQTLYGMLASYFANVTGQFGGVHQQIAGVGQQVGNADQRVAGVSQQISNLYQFEQGISQQVGQLQQRGAGGATLRDSVLAAYDGGLGDGAEGMARLSAGPVRIVSRAA